MSEDGPGNWRVRYLRLRLTNFLSYRSARLEFADLVALVGPNAAGKSNAVTALKLLREIPFHGLPTAIARRGGFDQLRHRSQGRPYDPALRLDFLMPGAIRESFYEIKLGALVGKRYEVKDERCEIHFRGNRSIGFVNKNGQLSWTEDGEDGELTARPDAGHEHMFKVPPGQSAVTLASSEAAYFISLVLQKIQTVEINPMRVGELQEPSSTREFESDGSNTASVYDELSTQYRRELVDELSSVVPGISRIEVRRLADKLTLAFIQETGHGKREFLAKQMSDGTLRAFGILLSTLQRPQPDLIVIEEPEVAIHLGALKTLVDILQQHANRSQIVITTHSADIVDSIDIDALRVVWLEDGESHVAPVAEHSREPVKQGLITPGELLRADSLDPMWSA